MYSANLKRVLAVILVVISARSRRDAVGGADSRSWTDAQAVADCSSEPAGGGTVRYPRGSAGSRSSSRVRVPLQYLGAISR